MNATAKNKAKKTSDIDAQIEKLSKMSEDEIDLSDIPEIVDWTGAVRGKFYRPVKMPVTIRLDADVLAWLRSGGRGYQTRANSLLRREMQSELVRRTAVGGTARRRSA